MCGRCAWVTEDPLYITYHDEEWGVPVRGDDVKLFEMLTLEGAQAGLSWITVLKRREGYRKAFDAFDPEKVAHYDDEKIAALLQNPGIIRNKLKVRGTVKNAQAFLRVQQEFGSFSDYVWSFVDGKPVQNAWTTLADVPAETDTSKKLSKDLKKRGFTFVGPTIMYAFMQATGMVNDHTTDCCRYEAVKALG
ncbi:MAG: DNA-3-methyladenine glycosylase I [Chloroflexota bacterium]